MNKTIELTRHFSHPIEKVWRALTDAEAVSKWLMPCDIQPTLGHSFQFKTKPSIGFDGIINCTITEIEPPHLLSYTWSGGGLKNTLVTFRLKEVDGGTEMHFSHTGFEGLVNQLIVRRILANGWKKKILTVQLQKHLDHD